MDLKVKFNCIGTVPIPLPDGSKVETFGVFKQDSENHPTDAYIGVSEDGRTFYYDKEKNCSLGHSPNALNSSLIVDRILEVLAGITYSKDRVPSQYHQVLGL